VAASTYTPLRHEAGVSSDHYTLGLPTLKPEAA
jgi:hypothetical protein